MKAIIFDFDGVILDSVNVKTSAFEMIYAPYGKEIQEKVKKHHLLNGGISRFEKFKYYHEFFLGIKIDDAELKCLTEKFSELVFNKVCNSNYIKGALSFLKSVSESHLTFICTGTPQDEIESILNFKSLNKYFDNIYGSPTSKESIINEIIVNYKLLNQEILFVGDAMTDYNAASKTNIKFIGVKNPETIFPENTLIVDDLLQIENYL